MFYYAVYKGRIPGIYDTWDKCQQQVTGFPASKFKKFKTLSEAQHFTKTGTELLSSLKKTKPLISNAKNIVSNTQLQNKTTNNISKKTYDTNDSITIYTDGSLIRKAGKIGCGYGIYSKSLNLQISEILPSPKTNNRAELTAIIEAIKRCPNDNKITIYTDSKYSILICTGTGNKYKRHGFVTKNTKGETVDVLNRDLIEIVLNLLDNYKVIFNHVFAHTGLNDLHSVGNDRADKLAQQASMSDLLS